MPKAARGSWCITMGAARHRCRVERGGTVFGCSWDFPVRVVHSFSDSPFIRPWTYDKLNHRISLSLFATTVRSDHSLTIAHDYRALHSWTLIGQRAAGSNLDGRIIGEATIQAIDRPVLWTQKKKRRRKEVRPFSGQFTFPTKAHHTFAKTMRRPNELILIMSRS